MSATPGLQSEDAQGGALAGVGVFMQQDVNDSRFFTCDHEIQHSCGMLCLDPRFQSSVSKSVVIPSPDPESS